jgi:hypothetical protein
MRNIGREEIKMGLVKPVVLRNEVFVRIDDRLLSWLDAKRGSEPRGTYVRRVLECEAVRELRKDGGDEAA